MFPLHRTMLSTLVLMAFTYCATAQNTGTPTTVVVAGKRTDVINEVDRKVYRVDNDLQATSGSAADVLNNIPSVDIDIDGNPSLRGDPGVTVLIDGKPAGQMQGKNRGAALQSLPAAQIARIEIITSPSAEFKPDGSGGIINIVTRSTRKAGRSAVLTANLGDHGRRNVNASGSLNTGPLSVDGGIDLRRDVRERVLDTDTATGARRDHAHRLEGNVKGRIGARLGIKFSPNVRQTLGLSLDYANRSDRRDFQERAIAGDGAVELRVGRGGEPRTDAGASLDFQQKLAHEGEAVSLFLQRTHSKETEQLTSDTLDSAGLVRLRERDGVEQLFGMSKATLAYVRPLDAATSLKLGLDLQIDDTGFNNQRAGATDGTELVADPAFDSRFRYRQQVNAGYATWGRKLAALEVLAGLRYEQVDIGTRQLLSGEHGEQHYAKLYPTLNLVAPFGEGAALVAGLSKRVRKVDPEDLNPAINSANPRILRQGNPDLKPEITDAIELGYRREGKEHTFGLAAYFRRSTNSDTELLTPLSDSAVLITKVNLPKSRSAGLELTGSGKLTPALGYTASGNLFHYQIEPQGLGLMGTRANVTLNAKAALNYQNGSHDRGQLSTNYRGRRLTPQGESDPVATLNLGYKHQWNSQLALVATVSDLFNSQRERRVYRSAPFEATYLRHPTGRVAYLGLVYSFEGSKKGKDADFTYD